MLYVVFKDRLGNNLFQFGAAYSLTDNVTICVPLKKEYDLLQSYKDIFFYGIKIINYIPPKIPVYYENGFEYNKIPYIESHDLIIDGYFQSYKYLFISKIRTQYRMPNNILDSIKKKYPILFSSPYCSIHVRRGDYMKILYKHPFAGKKYYKTAIKKMGNSFNYVIVSDDISWCKKHFRGANFLFIENTSFIEDFYIQVLAAHNIISNSSYSLWAAMLNNSKDKVVFAPSMWFGYDFKVNTSDLLPDYCKILKNSYSVKLFAAAFVERHTITLRKFFKKMFLI